MDFDFNLTNDFDVIIDIDMRVMGYKPAEPAPPCSDPSNPRFSDPGCDSEIEGFDFELIVNGTVIKLPLDVQDAIYNAIDKVLENKLDDEIMYKIQRY